jgi:hypothetical protein
VYERPLSFSATPNVAVSPEGAVIVKVPVPDRVPGVVGVEKSPTTGILLREQLLFLK